MPVPKADYWFLYETAMGYDHPIPVLCCIGTAAIYLSLVYIIWPWMRPVQPKMIKLAKSLRFYHNVALFLFSGFCFVTAFWWMFVNEEFGSGAAFVKMACEDVPDWMWWLHIVFTLSKLYEWIDTMWLVWLKPNGLSFLHVYHHATTFWLFLFITDLPGLVKMGLLLNGFVHMLMYYHYAWPLPKPLVPLVTLSQIAQLVFATYLWHITPDTCERFATFAEDHIFDFLTPYAFVPVYIFFFVRFFISRFIGGSKKATMKME